MKKVQFKVESLRKIPNPYGMFNDQRKTPEMYVTLVDVRNIPDDLPTKTNPREQNMRTKVASRICEGLLADNSAFYLFNRGILLSSKEVKFDNINSELTIFFEDEVVHGVVDGGHTYRTIKENRHEMDPNNQQYVKIEILTGIEDIFEDVAAARNTSVQVHDKSIAELKNKFDLIIKDTIKDEPFSDNIAYKENEDKDIDISDILTILYMFNLEKSPNLDKMPTSAFSGKQTCIKAYTEAYDTNQDQHGNQHQNPYFKMRSIMVDIFKLYDLIEIKMERKYREANSTGKYGSVKGVEKAIGTSKFYGEPVEYRSPKGFIYPILGAFRAIVEEKDGVYQWKANPFDYFEEIGKGLVFETVDRSRTLGNNPGSVGKDNGHWKQLYQNVLTNYLLKQMV
ncbi:AIPR family protein [Paenibacillus sp. DP01]|uniref:AIPR family protein n=1 Tax=Paenibacillus sp. DP01 TaxID=3373096 RepID=UPI00384CAC4F